MLSQISGSVKNVPEIAHEVTEKSHDTEGKKQLSPVELLRTILQNSKTLKRFRPKIIGPS